MTGISSTLKKSWLYGAIMLALLAILALTPPKVTFASNNFFEVLSFAKDSNNRYRVKVKINTTFTENWQLYTDQCALLSINGASGQPYAGEIWTPNIGGHALINFDQIDTSNCSDITYTAGQIYDLYISKGRSGMSGFSTWFQMNEDKNNLLPFTYTSSDYTFTTDTYLTIYTLYENYSQWFIPDSENYFFSEAPSLNITYPLDDDELVNNFYIQGSFTQPDPALYKAISAIGTTSETCSLSYNQMITDQLSGDVSIYVSGLSAGYYDFKIYFVNFDTGDFFLAKTISNIHIVSDLPYSLPPTENQPPSTAPPIFYHLDPSPYYIQNSTYSTSTKLFDTLTDTFSPILLTIGSHLTDFSTKFSASSASSTGTQFGQSVLIVRSYIGSVNSFFGGLPVSQFFLFYLVALSLVIVLRLIKGLIGLFKV